MASRSSSLQSLSFPTASTTVTTVPVHPPPKALPQANGDHAPISSDRQIKEVRTRHSGSCWLIEDTDER